MPGQFAALGLSRVRQLERLEFGLEQPSRDWNSSGLPLCGVAVRHDQVLTWLAAIRLIRW